MKPKRSLLSGTLLLISFLSFAQQGTLDNSFATGGRMIRNIGLQLSTIASVFQQTDGKIVVAGSASYLSTSYDFVLARFNSNGTLDPTFDGDGIVRTDINGNSNDYLYSAIQLSSGKILLASSEPSPVLVRYNSDGSLDNTFDGDGKLFLPAITNLRILKILEQPDGKILIAGGSGATLKLTVMRLTSDGLFDNTFDGDGIAVLNILAGSFYASEIALQPGDNKILLTGNDGATNSTLFAVTVRLHTNGSLDNSFGNSGVVMTNAGSSNNKWVSDLAVQSNGAIILSGNGYSGANNNLSYTLLVRYHPNGTLDTGFDGDGIVEMNTTNAFMASGLMVSLADNKIILSGQYKSTSGVQGLALQRINTNGTVDNSFGSNGVVQLPAASGNQFPSSGITQQSDGKLLQAAFVSDGLYFKPAVYRLLATGTADPSFDVDGVAVFNFTNDPFYDDGVSIAVAGDDSFVAAGYYINGWGYDGFISRYTSNGAPDLSFGTNGTVSLNQDINSFISSSLIQPDGKILVTGTSYDSWDGYRVVLARYLANGTPDNTFGTNGRMLFAVNPGDYNKGLDIALQNDGKLIVSVFNSSFTNGSRQMYIYRFNSNGSIDNSFGIAGRVALDFENYSSELITPGKHLVVQPDNKIVIVGVNSTYTKYAVKRFTANGAADNSFNSGNTLFGDYRGIAGDVRAVAVQNDGKIIIAGVVDEKMGVCRFMPDGSPDFSFNGDGIQIIAETGGANYPYAIYCQPDNKILISGTVNFISASNMLAVKLNTNGSLDNSFGTSGYSIIPNFGAGFDGAYAMAPQSTGKILLCGYVGLFSGDYDLAVYRINNSIATATSNTFTELKNIVAAPNPVTSKLQISSNQITPGKYNISVRTIDGKQLFSETITTNGNRLQYACSAANWPTGVLLVEIKGEGQFKLFKIVKTGN